MGKLILERIFGNDRKLCISQLNVCLFFVSQVPGSNAPVKNTDETDTANLLDLENELQSLQEVSMNNTVLFTVYYYKTCICLQ